VISDVPGSIQEAIWLPRITFSCSTQPDHIYNSYDYDATLFTPGEALLAAY
jgi:hypothetical protein